MYTCEHPKTITRTDTHEEMACDVCNRSWRTPLPVAPAPDVEAWARAEAEERWPLEWDSVSAEVWGQAPISCPERDAFIAGAIAREQELIRRLASDRPVDAAARSLYPPAAGAPVDGWQRDNARDAIAAAATAATLNSAAA